jgi:hypothetical protein
VKQVQAGPEPGQASMRATASRAVAAAAKNRVSSL